MSRHPYHVNFIADDLARVRRDRVCRNATWAAIIALALLLAPAHLGLSRRASHLRDEQSRLSAKIGEARPEAKRADELEEKHRLLQSRLPVVERARATEKRWARFLGVMAQKLPDDVWLTGIAPGDGTRSAEGGVRRSMAESESVTLAGVSESPSGVSKYVARLNYTDWFAAEVRLQGVERSMIGETPVYHFEVVGRMREPLGPAGDPR